MTLPEIVHDSGEARSVMTRDGVCELELAGRHNSMGVLQYDLFEVPDVVRRHHTHLAHRILSLQDALRDACQKLADMVIERGMLRNPYRAELERVRAELELARAELAKLRNNIGASDTERPPPGDGSLDVGFESEVA